METWKAVLQFRGVTFSFVQLQWLFIKLVPQSFRVLIAYNLRAIYIYSFFLYIVKLYSCTTCDDPTPFQTWKRGQDNIWQDENRQIKWLNRGKQTNQRKKMNPEDALFVWCYNTHISIQHTRTRDSIGLVGVLGSDLGTHTTKARERDEGCRAGREWKSKQLKWWPPT